MNACCLKQSMEDESETSSDEYDLATSLVNCYFDKMFKLTYLSENY